MSETTWYGDSFARDQLSARVLLRAIKANLAEASYFQREDLLHLPVFTHIATISRYNHIRLAVNALVQTGQLVRLSRTDLSLPGKARTYSADVAIHREYLDTIRLLIQKMGRKRFAVMDVVDSWRTDGHLTVNSKRVAVRQAIPQLLREKVCRKRNHFEFMVA